MTFRSGLMAATMLVTAGLTAPVTAQELELRETLNGHEAKVFSLAYSPDGKILAAGTVGGEIHLWETATNKGLAILKGHTQVVVDVQFSSDGKMLASAGNLDGTVRLWKVATAKLLHTLSLPKDTVNGVAFSPDSKTVAACGFKGKLPTWDVVTGKQVDTFAGERARCLAYSPDGKILAWGSDPQAVRLRDLATGREEALVGANMTLVKTIAFSPNGKTIAVAGGNVIRVWDIARKKELCQLGGHRFNVYKVAFSPDGELLASTSQDRTVRLWDIATAKLLTTHSSENHAATCVAFSPDGKTVAMTADKTVTLWTVPKAKSDQK